MDLLDVKNTQCQFPGIQILPKDEYKVGALKVVDVIMNTTLVKIQNEKKPKIQTVWKHKSVKYYQ